MECGNRELPISGMGSGNGSPHTVDTGLGDFALGLEVEVALMAKDQQLFFLNGHRASAVKGLWPWDRWIAIALMRYWGAA